MFSSENAFPNSELQPCLAKISNKALKLSFVLDRKELRKSIQRNYVRRNNLKNGLDAGFYDERLIPAFRGLILDEDEVCRGYVMAAMEKGRIPPDKEFLQRIKKKTQESGYFFYDSWRANIMEYKGMPCLIDLESVYPVSEYAFRKEQNKDMYRQRDHLIKNPAYREFVEKLYKDTCHNANDE